MTSISSQRRGIARAYTPQQVVRLATLFVIVFGSGIASIVVAKQSLVVAGVWLGNGAAIVGLMRLPSTRALEQLVATTFIVIAATLAANLAAGNTFTDSVVFTFGNGAEILVGYLILKFDPFTRTTSTVSENPVSRLILPVLLAATLAPAVGATVGATLLSARDEAGLMAIWTQWWLPSALGMLLIVPPGLLLTRKSLTETVRSMPIARDALLLVGAGVVVTLSVLVSRHMTVIMLATPVVLLAAIRYHGIGATLAILACVFPTISVAASDFGSIISTMPTASERLSLLQAYAVLTGLVGLWLASILDEKAALIRVLDQSTAAARDLSLARQRLLMTVAHDLRTPLSVIEGCSEMLVGGVRDADRDRRLMQAIGDSTETLRTLANDLLETARREAAGLTVDPQWFDPGRLLGSVIDELTVLGTNGSEPVALTSTGEVWADPHRFRQIATNLISNALKYGRGFGPVSVRVAPVDGGSLLVVSERGPGIDGSDMHLIFEPFGLTGGPVSSQSAGVGLALVKQLAEAHGGWVRCTSSPFVETRMDVFLPHPGTKTAPLRATNDVASIDPDTVF